MAESTCESTWRSEEIVDTDASVSNILFQDKDLDATLGTDCGTDVMPFAKLEGPSSTHISLSGVPMQSGTGT